MLYFNIKFTLLKERWKYTIEQKNLQLNEQYSRQYGKLPQPHNAGLFIHPSWSQKVHSILGPGAGLALIQGSVTTTSTESLSCSLGGKVLSTETSTILVSHTIGCSPDSRQVPPHNWPQAFLLVDVFIIYTCSLQVLGFTISSWGGD